MGTHVLNIKASVKFTANEKTLTSFSRNIISGKITSGVHGIKVSAWAFLSKRKGHPSHLNLSGLKDTSLSRTFRELCEDLNFVQVIDWTSFTIDNITILSEAAIPRGIRIEEHVSACFSSHSNYEKFPALFLRKKTRFPGNCVGCKSIFDSSKGFLSVFKSGKIVATGAQSVHELFALIELFKNVQLYSRTGVCCRN